MAQKWARRDTKNMVLRLLPLYSYGQVQRSKSEICFFAFLNSKKVFCRKQFQCPRESNPRPSDPALESKTFLAQRSIACCLIPYLSKGLVEATQIFYLVQPSYRYLFSSRKNVINYQSSGSSVAYLLGTLTRCLFQATPILYRNLV